MTRWLRTVPGSLGHARAERHGFGHQLHRRPFIVLGQMAAVTGLLVECRDEPGVLYRITEAIFRHGANISYVAGGAARREEVAELQLEVSGAPDSERLIADLQDVQGVTRVTTVPTFQMIYGKRVIVIGGGAQVGMVAQGAISEADRHNIRGERISVDTIPLVGEEQLADAVRAVARLHRARALVLAGALMGGDISNAVREIRKAGILVLCTSMAGSVPDAADVVVSDPVEAGVMAVMLIADTAKFSIEHVRGKRF
jgi:energy-converting hydrogenase B subunit Q